MESISGKNDDIGTLARRAANHGVKVGDHLRQGDPESGAGHDVSSMTGHFDLLGGLRQASMNDRMEIEPRSMPSLKKLS